MFGVLTGVLATCFLVCNGVLDQWYSSAYAIHKKHQNHHHVYNRCTVAITTPPYTQQINEALSDQPAGLEYALRQEADYVIKTGQRIMTAMAKYALCMHQ